MIKDIFKPCWVTCLHGIWWHVYIVFNSILTLCLMTCLPIYIVLNDKMTLCLNICVEQSLTYHSLNSFSWGYGCTIHHVWRQIYTMFENMFTLNLNKYILIVWGHTHNIPQVLPYFWRYYNNALKAFLYHVWRHVYDKFEDIFGKVLMLCLKPYSHNLLGHIKTMFIQED